MKGLIIFSAVLILSACGGNAPASMETEGKGLDITPDQLTSQKDPVCGMNMAEVKIADTLHYNNGVYAFCAPGCKDAFKENPEKYLSELN